MLPPPKNGSQNVDLPIRGVQNMLTNHPPPMIATPFHDSGSLNNNIWVHDLLYMVSIFIIIYVLICVHTLSYYGNNGKKYVEVGKKNT